MSELALVRNRLERFGWPRLQMMAIVLVTAVAGLVVSFLLRMAGIDSMPLRYPLAILAAYGVFLLQMWAWMRWRDDPVDDVLDAGADLATSMPGEIGAAWTGAGGRSGGAGSSASWSATADSTASADASVLDAVEGEHLPVVVILALVATAVIAAGWVVWSAPALMAELILDAAIAGGLYRRMRVVEAQGWWWVCVRHTAWPLAGVIVFFGVLGGIVQLLVPEASTLLEGLRAI
ncbi:MAG TPA: hypothetical protein VIT62_16585 [Lysobacter sp.]